MSISRLVSPSSLPRISLPQAVVWPSFSRPISKELIHYYQDLSHGMERIEVRSRSGNAHLGHVFTDGPQELGGLRYCINSASLRFIAKDEMEEAGYGYLLPYLNK